MRTRSRIALSLVPALALLAACSQSQNTQEEMNEASSTSMKNAAPETLMLSSLNESDITGSITLSHSADTLSVKLSLDHLTPGDDYPAGIYHGTCEAEGPKIAALKSVLASEEGSGSSTTAVPRSAFSETPTEQRHEGFFVKVEHPDAVAAACVNLPSEEENATM